MLKFSKEATSLASASPNSGKLHLRFRFGPYEVDPDARTLRKGGTPIHLPEQPWQVLCALLERPGAVVTREQLQERLWRGTFVDFEKGLNRAVNKLREVLSDSAEKPRFVETVVGQGYRFIAPVEKVVAASPVPVMVLPSQPSKRKPWRWIFGFAGVLAVILITGLWPLPPPNTRVTRLTSDGRSKSSETGEVALHSGRVFYLASELGSVLKRYDLWSVPAAGGEPRHEPTPCPAEREGVIGVGASYIRQRFLFMCQLPGCCDVDYWLTGFDGSNPMRIGRYSLGRQWVSISPGLNMVLFSRDEGLFAGSVDSGAERLLARVDGFSWGAFWHPMGTRIGFQRIVDGRNKLWEMRADGTGMRPLVPGFAAEQCCGRWSPDGRRLYFISQGDVYLQGSRSWLGWLRRPAPARLTSGPVRFYRPSEDPADPLTVFAVGDLRSAQAMKLNRQTNAFEPFLGGIAADCIDYSPDGQWIAYVSWPNGELWKSKTDGSSKELLEDGLITYMPRWSPDASRIAFAARARDAAGATQPFRIYTIAASGGRAELVPGVPGAAFDPNWSPDGKRLAFAPNYPEGSKEQQHVSILNLETGAIETVPGSENLFSVRWSPDGKWLAALTYDRFWPVVYSFGTQKWSVLRQGAAGFPRWSKDSRYLYCQIQIGPGQSELARIEVATRKVEEIHKVTEFAREGVLFPGVSWTPDDEPIVLKDLTTSQVYRIDRDR